MMVGDRIRALREAKDWSQGDLAKAVRRLGGQLSQQNAANIENGIVKRPKALPEIAQALGTTELYLRDGRGPKIVGEPITLPVSSIVGAGDDVAELIEGDGPIDHEEAPPGMTEGEVTEVRGRSMRPFYGDGDRLFHRFLAGDATHLIGEPVVVRLKDGRRLVKILQAGSKRGRYDLESINPLFPTLADQAVDAVAEIVWVKKRAKPRSSRG